MTRHSLEEQAIPRIAVIGAGAVGSGVGALLHRAGQNVVLIGRSAHVAAIRQKGLRVDGCMGTFVAPVEAAEALDFRPDLALLAVKTQDTVAAVKANQGYLQAIRRGEIRKGGLAMEVINLKEKEVFKKDDRGFANLVDEKYLQINQVCLEPGQQVPHHNANSNVTLTVIYGEGTLQVGSEMVKMGPGKLLRVPFQSPMSIKNESKERLAFLVIKTPHPGEMK